MTQKKNKDDAFICYQWMISDLQLKGIEKDIFAIIYSYTRDGQHQFYGSLDYLADWVGASRRTIINTLHSLTERGFIVDLGINENYKTRTYVVNLDLIDSIRSKI